MNASDAPRPLRRRLPAGTAAAVTVLVVLLATASRYGPHGDELYFRLLDIDWWYDDQPPLTVWLARLARAGSDAVWVQRVPAALATAAGAFVAAAFPRLLGQGRRAQELAAWSHVGATYTLVVGHVFLTSTFDLLAWQLVVLCVVAATLGRPHALVWAGAVAGVACWNKLLVIPLVGALVVSLLLGRRDLVRTRQFALGAAVFVAVGGPQLAAQGVHGWPMASVSGDLAAVNGHANRLLVLPLLVAFVGPPLVGVCARGLAWRPPGSRVGLLSPAAGVLVAWNLFAPAQPYYAVALLLAALSLGWGPTASAGAVGAAGGLVWRRAGPIVAVSAAVAALIALPLLPVGSAAYSVTSAINPPSRDQVGWPSYVRQVDAARGSGHIGAGGNGGSVSAGGSGGSVGARGAGDSVGAGDTVGAGDSVGDGEVVAVVTDAYSLAGAIAYESRGRIPVASGHNALWRQGPPPTDTVLLVGRRAVALRGRFASCVDAGHLTVAESDPFGVAGSPMVRCRGPRGGWPALWPAFRHLGA